MKRSQLPQSLCAALCIVLMLIFAATGFTHIGCLIGAWILLLAAAALILDYEEWLIYLEEVRADREAIDMLLEAESFEIWCDLFEENQRRHLMEELDRISA